MAMEFLVGACIALALGLTATFVLLVTRKPVFIDSLKGKHVFITGASSGIGLAIAKKCAQEGSFVTLVSRSHKNLEDAVNRLVKETHCSRDMLQYQAADVGDYGAIAGSVQKALEWKPIDVLVCNAGLTRGDYLERSSIEDVDTVIRTNLNGVIYSLHEALPSLKEHSKNHPVSVVIISSIASFFFMYGHSVYTATKYALRGLAECLRGELFPHKNMRVTLICPGFVNTPFLEDLDNQGEITEVLQKVNYMSKKSSDNPEHTASCTVEALKRGRYLVVTELMGDLLLTLGRGVIPADTMGRYLLELVLMFPFRLILMHNGFRCRRLIVETVRKYCKP